MVHPHSVRKVQFSPDGTRILTVEGGEYEQVSTARLWDSKTGEPIGNAMVHPSSIDAAVFSPDGTRILTASSDRTARQWDAATGQPIGQTMMHKHFVVSASYNQDGTRILTACGEAFDNKHGSAKLWDAATSQPNGVPVVIGSFVVNISFNRAGTHFVTGSRDGIARVWDVETGQPMGTAIVHPGMRSTYFNPAGTRVLTGGNDKTARLWDVRTGQPIGKIMSHEGPINSATFSADGSLIVTAGDDKVARLWEGKSGEPLGVSMPHPDKLKSAAFSPDGTRIVTACDDKTARLWNVKTGKPLGELMKHRLSVDDAGFSPDGARVLTTSGDFIEPSQLLWDAKTGMPTGAPMEIKNYVNSAHFSPDSTRIVIALGVPSGAGTARLWDARTGLPLGAAMPHKMSVEGACFSPDSTLITTACGDECLRLWDAFTGQPFGVAMFGAVWRPSFSPNGKRVTGAASADSVTRLWEINTDQALESVLAEDVSSFCSGWRLDPALGTLTKISPAERMVIWDKIREVLAAPELSDWKFAVERHLPVSNPDALCSPRMTMPRHEMLESMILSRTPELVREALAIEPGNPLLPYALAEIENRGDDKTGSVAVRVQFLRQYGHKRLSAEIAKNPRSATGYVAMARSFHFALDLSRKDIAIDWSGADKRQQHCIVLWQHLVEAMPENAEWQMELAGSLHLAGQMQQAQNHPAEAEAYYMKALEIAERLKKSGQRPAQDTLEEAIRKNLDLVRKAQAGQPPGVK
ncbi:MAG: hypothetical protein ABL962_06670 [Fimbriimonadaceae bacterium]